MAPQVSLKRCETYEPEAVSEAVRAVLDPLGGMQAYVSPGQRVLLKPNLLAPKPLTPTEPSLIVAVAKQVREAGAQPIVGDSCALGSITRVARWSGLNEALCAEGFEPAKDLSTSRSGRAEREGKEYPQLNAYLDEIDAVINLPKVKVHQQCYLTLAIKNLFGCVPRRRKALWHFKRGNTVDFADMLLSIYQTIQPVLHIADGIVAMERKGPVNGDPHPVGVLSASTDGVATDRVWLELLGGEVERMAVMAAAERAGLGDSTDLALIEILGQPLEACRAEGFCMIPEPEMIPIKFSLTHIVRGVWKEFWARRKRSAPSTG